MEIERGCKSLVSAGHELQVDCQSGQGQLFLLHGNERRRVEWKGEGYALRGPGSTPCAIDELIQVIEENPAIVSPAALTRPLVQDAVLGTALLVLGPGELSYLAQSKGLYPLLDIEAPAVTLRPHVMILDAVEHRQLSELTSAGISLELLLGNEARLHAALAGDHAGELIAPLRDEIRVRLAALRSPLLELDPGLERPLEKTRQHIEHSLGLLATKAQAAAARRDTTLRGRVDRLRAICLPGGSLQDRPLSSIYPVGRFGPQIVGRLERDLDLDPRWLQLFVEQGGEAANPGD
jgi:uncharacterized protein YllA (UPF0747 family)